MSEERPTWKEIRETLGTLVPTDQDREIMQKTVDAMTTDELNEAIVLGRIQSAWLLTLFLGVGVSVVTGSIAALVGDDTLVTLSLCAVAGFLVVGFIGSDINGRRFMKHINAVIKRQKEQHPNDDNA